MDEQKSLSHNLEAIGEEKCFVLSTRNTICLFLYVVQVIFPAVTRRKNASRVSAINVLVVHKQVWALQEGLKVC